MSNEINTLKEHQQALYRLLLEFDRVCKKIGVNYILFAGTMLGAVRHKGFIPWDDDIDVIMLREDYDRFLQNAEEFLDTKTFFLQKEFSEHYPMFFSKLRLNNTACIERYYPKDLKTHLGVYIDIFPCDNAFENCLGKKIQFLLSKVVIAKSLWKRGYLTNSVKKKLFMRICCCLPYWPFRQIVKNRQKVNSSMVHSFFASASKYEKNVYPRKWLTETCMMQFEGEEFPVSVYYDEMLSTIYGDYMTLPSEEDRKCKVHAIKIDLQTSYEKYFEWLAEQKIDIYTRSIR